MLNLTYVYYAHNAIVKFITVYDRNILFFLCPEGIPLGRSLRPLSQRLSFGAISAFSKQTHYFLKMNPTIRSQLSTRWSKNLPDLETYGIQ